MSYKKHTYLTSYVIHKPYIINKLCHTQTIHNYVIQMCLYHTSVHTLDINVFCRHRKHTL